MKIQVCESLFSILGLRGQSRWALLSRVLDQELYDKLEEEVKKNGFKGAKGFFPAICTADPESGEFNLEINPDNILPLEIWWTYGGLHTNVNKLFVCILEILWTATDFLNLLLLVVFSISVVQRFVQTSNLSCVKSFASLPLLIFGSQSVKLLVQNQGLRWGQLFQPGALHFPGMVWLI